MKTPGKIQNQNSKTNINNLYKYSALILIAVLALYFIFSYFGNPGVPKDDEYMFKKNGELTFWDSAENELTKIDIQIAQTEFDRQLGLMFRKDMKENEGMLFIFPDNQVRNFWMRNTEIPLDMLFIDSSKVILNIAKNTTPYSDNSYSSIKPAKYVLEVNGGFSDKYKVTPGNKVTWIETQ